MKRYIVLLRNNAVLIVDKNILSDKEDFILIPDINLGYVWVNRNEILLIKEIGFDSNINEEKKNIFRKILE